MDTPTTTSTMRVARRLRWLRPRGALLAWLSIGALCSSLVISGSARAATPHHPSSSAGPQVTRPKTKGYPVGIRDRREPSHFAPPGPNALRGYTRAYVDDFNGPLSPTRWFLFSGVPSGDPDGRFAPDHVSVKNGVLEIGTWRDPSYGGEWTSGGAGLSGEPFQYGAIFVRSRENAPGPDTVELLWPANNQWPPEIDFDEAGPLADKQWWWVHYGSGSNQDRIARHQRIDIVRWHTYGVIWTPTSIRFTVDGRLWGEVTAPYAIPDLPMALDLQAQSWCGIAGEPCPTRPSVLLVDWVAIYLPK